MKISPLGSKIVVKSDPSLEVRRGKIIIPATVTSLTEKNIHGTVLAVGPGVRNRKTGKRSHPLDVEPGDRVVLGKYAGSRIFVERMEIMLIDISEILAIEEPENTPFEVAQRGTAEPL